jgi:hypothetical protein
MIAPCSVSTPAKGAPVAGGRTGRTPDLVVVSRAGGGGGASVTCDWAEARAAKAIARTE